LDIGDMYTPTTIDATNGVQLVSHLLQLADGSWACGSIHVTGGAVNLATDTAANMLSVVYDGTMPSEGLDIPVGTSFAILSTDGWYSGPWSNDAINGTILLPGGNYYNGGSSFQALGATSPLPKLASNRIWVLEVNPYGMSLEVHNVVPTTIAISSASTGLQFTISENGWGPWDVVYGQTSVLFGALFGLQGLQGGQTLYVNGIFNEEATPVDAFIVSVIQYMPSLYAYSHNTYVFSVSLNSDGSAALNDLSGQFPTIYNNYSWLDDGSMLFNSVYTTSALPFDATAVCSDWNLMVY